MQAGREAGESGRLWGAGRGPGGSGSGAAAVAGAAAARGSVTEPRGGGRCARCPPSARCPAARPGPLLQARCPECAGAARSVLAPPVRPWQRGPRSRSPTPARPGPTRPLWASISSAYLWSLVAFPGLWVSVELPKHLGQKELGDAVQQVGARKGRDGPQGLRPRGYGLYAFYAPADLLGCLSGLGLGYGSAAAMSLLHRLGDRSTWADGPLKLWRVTPHRARARPPAAG